MTSLPAHLPARLTHLRDALHSSILAPRNRLTLAEHVINAKVGSRLA